MHTLPSIHLPDVQQVYGGPEGDLWELLMGEQIHLGGLQSSLALAERAGVGAGQTGGDLCCCSGAGMRFLVRIRQVAHMTGIDATPRVIERGRARCSALGLGDQIDFVQADVTHTGLPTDKFDFVWGEDAWCYVEDKDLLIAEATRLAKPRGTVAFTDWVEGPAGLTPAEANRFLAFMKFPSLQTLAGYRTALEANGCHVDTAEDTGRFAPCMDLYLAMVQQQLTYDALRILGFDTTLMNTVAEEMQFIRDLAHANKVCQGLFVARTP